VLERLKNIACLSLKFLIAKIDLLNVISQNITAYKIITMMLNENLLTEPCNSCHRIELFLFRLLWDQKCHYCIHKSLLLDSLLSQTNPIHICTLIKIHFNITILCKIKLSLYRLWRPLGCPEVEDPAFSDIRLIDGGKVVSPMRWPLFPPGRFVVLISVRSWANPRAVVQLEGLGKLKKSTSSRTQTGNLPACSIIPQPTTLLHAPYHPMYIY
jgi:hypothetical protein